MVVEVIKIIKKSPSKSCTLDPLPTALLKTNLDSIAPIITNIVNMSLSSSVIPNKLKQALITPLIKKPSLDPEVYRPVSDLTFLSRVIMKKWSVTVCLDIWAPMASRTQYENSIHSDLLWVADDQQLSCLVLLDLPTSFDTVDHRLQRSTGVRAGTNPLHYIQLWSRSYNLQSQP